MTVKESIKAELKFLDTEALLELVYCVSDVVFSRNLEDLLFNESPREIVRMTQYGDCKVEDDYFTINAYGNLKSFSSDELKNYILVCYDDEITDYLIKNPDQLKEYLDFVA